MNEKKKVDAIDEVIASGVKRAKMADSDVTYQDSDQLIKAKREIEASTTKKLRIKFVKSYTERDL